MLFLVFLIFFSADTLGCPSPRNRETTPEVIIRNGYKCETHSVTTKDGYYLTLHRILSNKNCRGERRVCLLMHGIFQSSYFWVFTDRGYSLAFKLTDLCCDVWLGNLRGNCYSKGHEYRSKHKYYEFSQDEMGKYDVPATIHYILERTNQTCVMYFGYSLGTMVSFIAVNEVSNFNSLICSAYLMAPVAYMKHSTSLQFKAASNVERPATFFTQQFGNFEFCPTNKYTVDAVSVFCSFFPDVCKLGLMACGDSLTKYNNHVVSKAMAMRCGTSTKVLLQFAQYYKNLTFSKYNYGGNAVEEYDLGKVTFPVYIYHSSCDKCADPEDVGILKRKLKNVQNVTYFEKCLDHNCFVFCGNKTVEIYSKVISDFIRKR